VVPSTYSLMLKVNRKGCTRPLTSTLDPRVHVSQADLVEQLAAEQNISAQMAASFTAYDQVTTLRAAIADRAKAAAGNPTSLPSMADALKSLDEHAAKLETGSPQDLGFGPLNRELARLATMVESGDARPAEPLQAGINQACQNLAKRIAEWSDLNKHEVPNLNPQMQTSGMSLLPVKSEMPRVPECK